MPNLRLIVVAVVMVLSGLGTMAGAKLPTVKDPELILTLLASDPDIVTPIGIAIDRKGLIYVLESHTHLPSANYPGPRSDRVRVFQVGNEGRTTVRGTSFAENLYHAMHLAFSPDGQLYVTHRNGVMLLQDHNGDGVSEARTTILEVQTHADYPHNGMAGIAFSADGWLYAGLGENTGEEYTVRGSDGSTYRGGGEGGNIFRCRPDGRELQFVATGFWNPFGLAFDEAGHLLAVDNDPDSRPPCRLLHVVPDGDYGFKFRFGRDGLHPYLAWNGELPGTLPMIAGTGEAPSGILRCEAAKLPGRYRGQVLVTSWGDHTIEAFHPKPFGASLRAERTVLIEGDDSFRPVGIAAGPDGAVYFTDWVSKEYSVHRQGRLWRLASVPGAAAGTDGNAQSKINPAEARLRNLHDAQTPDLVSNLLEALTSDDPFIRAAAVSALARPAFRPRVLDALRHENSAVRLGALLALRRARWDDKVPILSKLLIDPDPQVRLMALIWTGEERVVELANRIEETLASGMVTPALFHTYSATAKILGDAQRQTNRATGNPGQPARGADSTSAVRVLAMAAVSDQNPAPWIGILTSPEHRTDTLLRAEAARRLGEMGSESALVPLRTVALSVREPIGVRAEAILGLAGYGVKALADLVPLLNDPEPEIRLEAARALRSVADDPGMRDPLRKRFQQELRGASDSGMTEALAFALHSVDASAQASYDKGRPTSEEEWRRALSGEGNSVAGRRVFFNPGVGCARCHRIEDHGGQVGPALSTIARAANREKLMQSILHPSKEIAPQFVPHTVAVRDGQTFQGLVSGTSTDGALTLVTAEGKGIYIPASEMVSNEASQISLMPEGLENTMTVSEFRDLLAFLLSLR